MQTDPIGYGDGMNMYAYVGGDPVNKIDPTGLAADQAQRDEVVVHGSATTFVGANAVAHFGGQGNGRGPGGGRSSEDERAIIEAACNENPVCDEIVVQATRTRRFSDGTRINLSRGRPEQAFIVTPEGIYPITDDLYQRINQKCEDSSEREGLRIRSSAFQGQAGGHTHPRGLEGIPGPEDGAIARSLGTSYVISHQGAFRVEYRGGQYQVTQLSGRALTSRERRELNATVDRWNNNQGGSGVICTTTVIDDG